MKENAGGDTWERIPSTSIQLSKGGMLMIVQSHEMHEKIAELLNLYRQYK